MIEKFKLFPKEALAQIGSQFIACQVIGVARYLAECAGIPVELQEPQGNVNSFFNDRRLRETGYVPAGVTSLYASRHQIDAIRHGLHYLHFRERYAYTKEAARGSGPVPGGSSP